MSNEDKSEQLGMPFGTANNKLRKMVLFHLLKKYNDNFCFQCGALIETVDELSIEHKKPWLHENTDLYWDMDNIAFSHHHCNCAAARQTKERHIVHGTETGYTFNACRCDKCRDAHKIQRRDYRERKAS